MAKRLRVSNLGTTIDKAKLGEILSSAGTVQSVRLVEDQYSGISRGFAFVEMASEQEGIACIEKFNGKEHEGRVLTVVEDTSPAPRAKRVTKAKK